MEVNERELFIVEMAELNEALKLAHRDPRLMNVLETVASLGLEGLFHALLTMMRLAAVLNVPFEYVAQYAASFIYNEKTFHRELKTIPIVIDLARRELGAERCIRIIRTPWSDVIDYEIECIDSSGEVIRIAVEVTRSIADKNIDRIERVLKHAIENLRKVRRIKEYHMVIIETPPPRIKHHKRIF